MLDGSFCLHASFEKNVFSPIGDLYVDQEAAKFDVYLFPDRNGAIHWNWIRQVAPHDGLELYAWAEKALIQYLAQGKIDSIFSRMPAQIWINASYEEPADWTREKMATEYTKNGLQGALLLRAIYFCFVEKFVLVQFTCEVDDYLSEYGFCLTRQMDKVTFMIDDLAYEALPE